MMSDLMIAPLTHVLVASHACEHSRTNGDGHSLRRLDCTTQMPIALTGVSTRHCTTAPVICKVTLFETEALIFDWILIKLGSCLP
jgi:hypothetical protein